MNKLASASKIIVQRIGLATNKLRTSAYFKQLFSGKRVAVVGGSPSLAGKGLGEIIDRHDLVVRINLMTTTGIEQDIGSRTDVRFLGATMLDRHTAPIEACSKESLFITTSKNRPFIRKHGLMAYFYHQNMPMQSYSMVASLTSSPAILSTEKKPPKSGVVMLAMLAKFGRPSDISIYGFSHTEKDAWNVYDYQNKKLKAYDPKHILENHCNPQTDIALISLLEKSGIVKVGDR